MDKLAVNKFNLEDVTSDSNILIIGRRKAGKKILSRDILYNHRTIPNGLVFSETEEACPFYSDFVPKALVHPEYRPELIESLLDNQRHAICEASKNGIADGKTAKNKCFIVMNGFQDCQRRNSTIRSIFFMGRHLNILSIFTVQHPLVISPELRNNLDYVFIFSESSVQNRKRIYEDYAAIIPSFELFCNIFDKCTENNGCMVIKTSGNTINDRVFHYKAQEHGNFKMAEQKNTEDKVEKKSRWFWFF